MTEPRVESLRGIRLFEGLDDQALARIADLAAEFRVAEGHVLIERGLAGSGMFIIEEGRVVVDVPGSPKELGPGDFVGETALLTDVPRTARVQAATDVTGLAIGRHDFRALLDEQPKIAVRMLECLALRIADQD